MRGLAALMLLAACAHEAASDYAAPGPWRLVGLNGTPVPGETTLSFPERGRVEGTLPCNMFTAQQTAPYPWFILSHFEIAQGTCDANDREERIIEALASVTRADIQGPMLILSSEDGHRLAFRLD